MNKDFENTKEELSRLNKKYWYLRDGDLLPERIEMFLDGKGIRDFAQLDMLDKSGNLFATREEALAASNEVRACLARLRHQASP